MNKQIDTVFILGAGASVDHGYPTGIHLLEDIVNLLEDNMPLISKNLSFSIKFRNQGLIAILLCMEESLSTGRSLDRNEFKEYMDLIERFYMRIKHSTPRSIDDFIHAQVDMESDTTKIEKIKKIGKLLIVLRLLYYEEKSTKYNYTQDTSDPTYRRVHGESSIIHPGIYRQISTFFTALWQNLYDTSYKNFKLNLSRISFITFNYDRLLEAFIFNTAKNFFGVSTDQLFNDIGPLLEKNIIHVYGRLGPLEWECLSGMEYGKISFKPLEILLKDVFSHANKNVLISPNSNDQDRIQLLWAMYSEMQKIVLNKNSRVHQRYNYEALNFILDSIGKIRTYTESIQSNHPKIKKKFDHIYFLGFSFHELNVKTIDELLEINALADTTPPYIYASIYGMKKQEVFNAEKLVINKVLHKKGHTNQFVRFVENFDIARNLKIHDFFKSVPNVRFIRK